ncbi:MAG: hypothetical protein E4G74_01020 [Erysipelotrichales bacterium]|nr:MAG: hypothetical protein E4G74_01020 [Erysipelotrichales bacterium]
MQPKLKSSLITGSLIIFLALITVSLMLTFVSGPLEKQRRDRTIALKRVAMDYSISEPVYLNASNFDRVCIIGEGFYEGNAVYFASDSLGRVLDRIEKTRINVATVVAFATKSMVFENPITQIAYFKGAFVVAVIEKTRETLLNIEDYSVVLTVEIGK